jgi:3',5'-nucleoside bisphosphate phosphatase
VTKGGIEVFSITDHDTVGACRELKGTINFIPGVEITTHYKEKTLHLLAYRFDPENVKLESFLEKQKIARRKRAEDIMNLLNSDLARE